MARNITTRRLDAIRRVLEEGEPHLGPETEGIVIDRRSFAVVHAIGGLQPTEAVKRRIAQHGAAHAELARDIVPDVPETIVEANPGPLRSPVSTAAAQRLMVLLVDSALQELNAEHGHDIQLLHGAAWRPPWITPADASSRSETFKLLYDQFQIAVHGDKVGAAAGDHLNLSAPWLGEVGDAETSRKLIEMTARMRLVGGALSIALSASSPLFFGAGIERPEPVYGTTLTPWESARLGHVWPGRTIMDVSGLYHDPVTFRRTLRRFAETGSLLSGRDVWLSARAQPGTVAPGRSFDELCRDLGLDVASEAGMERARTLLHACFRYGPVDPENPHRSDHAWRRMEEWRQDLLERTILAPRSRVEIRTLETPPAFAADSPGGFYRTPYSWIKALHAFLEVMFVWLAENPPLTDDLEYGELELQAAKSNEQSVLLGGLDAPIRWIPVAMHSMSAREALVRVLKDTERVAEALSRTEDLDLVRRAAAGEVDPPAERIRKELGAWYGIDVRTRHNARLLPDDSYPRELLRRTRAAMDLELDEIEKDIPRMPALDRPVISGLLARVRELRAPFAVPA